LKVAIFGGESKEASAALVDRSWQIWGLNLVGPGWLFKSYVGIDKMFHLHKRDDLQKDIPLHLDAFEKWALEHPEVEYVLLEPWEKLPKATIFPHWILRELPRGAYHCSSFDWMISYALHLGATEILLSGIKMRSDGEPISATPCIEYWCGYAEGRGVKVTAAPDCDLFYNYHLVRSRYVYGYDSWDLIEDRTVLPEPQQHSWVAVQLEQ